MLIEYIIRCLQSASGGLDVQFFANPPYKNRTKGPEHIDLSGINRSFLPYFDREKHYSFIFFNHEIHETHEIFLENRME